ncbi:MAG: hypothetical protein ABI821_16570 [Pseudomonadota bacterium]
MVALIFLLVIAVVFAAVLALEGGATNVGLDARRRFAACPEASVFVRESGRRRPLGGDWKFNAAGSRQLK